MTDDAWAYPYSLRDVVAALGARQLFIKPHCPWQTGKVERLGRTLQTEWAYRHALASLRAAESAIAAMSTVTWPASKSSTAGLATVTVRSSS